MVKARKTGYMRSGNNLFFKFPSGKVVNVGASKMLGQMPKILKTKSIMKK